MSKPPDREWQLSDTLSLSEYLAPTNWHYQSGPYGFWLYDATRGMNLSMRAKTEREAFVEALEYYQTRLSKVEASYKALKERVDAFVHPFIDECE